MVLCLWRPRLCMRFIPVEHSCQANLEDIRSAAASLVPIALPERDGDAEPETVTITKVFKALHALC